MSFDDYTCSGVVKSLSLVVEYSLNFTGVFKVITFSGTVCLGKEDTVNEHI